MDRRTAIRAGALGLGALIAPVAAQAEPTTPDPAMLKVHVNVPELGVPTTLLAMLQTDAYKDVDREDRGIWLEWGAHGRVYYDFELRRASWLVTFGPDDETITSRTEIAEDGMFAVDENWERL